MRRIFPLNPSKVELTLTHPSLLHKVSNNPFLGETDSIQTGVSDLLTHMDGDDSANGAAAIGNHSDAGELKGSPAGAV
jgi:hypothetical protein